MKRLFSLVFMAVLTAALLCGCSSKEPETVAPTPEPTPAAVTYDGALVDERTESLTLRADSDLEALATLADRLPALARIDFGSREPSAEELAMLRAAFPAAQLQYSLAIGGKTFPWDAEELDLSFLPKAGVEEAISAMELLENLQYVDLGTASEEDGDALTLEEVQRFREAFPETAFDYRFSLFGVELSTLDEKLNFQGVKMDDEGEAVRAILPFMTRCTMLDMDGCGVSNEAMAAIRDDFPDVKVVWYVTFASVYGARTDTERLVASDWKRLATWNTHELIYFTDVKYLDLGHNRIDNISFVSYMPKLEVAILALNTWSDASPLADCKNLEYLEMFTTRCSDLSPLAELTNLRHLNIAYLTNLRDISPLYGLTNLERLWIGKNTKVPKSQIDEIQALLPDCELNITVDSPTGAGWRNHPRYELLKEQMGIVNGPAYSYIPGYVDPKF